MKKPLTIILGLALVALVGFGVAMVAPFLIDPTFEVVNQSQQMVYVSAYWRNESKELGPIQPLSSYKFKVNDEAAMKFSGRYPDGQELESKEVPDYHFTSANFRSRSGIGGVRTAI